ncbi:C40 family peptidase [Mycobacterium sp. TY815]|uniref:C40 family peptidase n=1 Tax=Mycobacterium sp. TY815 TaxID=3050581 RepID=UPI0027413B64|nr:C40 family peptidase [Mycobacterium sp. TY815]MDP7707389.1 C40 family peptidase [Mycobacterium sp. TY815]
MDAVIAAAVADVRAMGGSTNTPAGQRALVAAIKRHLEQTQDTLDHAQGDAGTRAAAAQVNAANYAGIGQPTTGAGAALPQLPMPQLPSVPMGGLPLGGVLAPLAGLSSMFSQGGGPQTMGNVSGLSGPASGFGGGGSAGEQVVKRALSQLGVKYSFGGGSKQGPSPGADGVGFDCSGLVQFAYGGSGINVPRTTYGLQHAGVAVPLEQARPGDILLCNYSAPGVPQHVQIVMSASQTVEAPDRGLTVRVGRWPSGHVEVRRLVD